MACSVALSGLTRDCQPSQGGIKWVALVPREDVTSIVTAQDKISAITMSTGKLFKKYEFRAGSSYMTMTRNRDDVNGVNYVQTDLYLQFNRMETVKRVEMEALAQDDLYAIVMDGNGAAWFLGFDNPVVCNAGGGQTGTARTDGNFYHTTLQDNANALPYEINVGTGSGAVDLDTIIG